VLYRSILTEHPESGNGAMKRSKTQENARFSKTGSNTNLQSNLRPFTGKANIPGLRVEQAPPLRGIIERFANQAEGLLTLLRSYGPEGIAA